MPLRYIASHFGRKVAGAWLTYKHINFGFKILCDLKGPLKSRVIHQLGRGSSMPGLLIAVFGETGPRYRRVSDLEAGLIG